MSPAAPPRPDEILVEHRRNGQWLKVVAVCPVTGLEATAAGPAREPEAVQRLAVAKLMKVLADR